MAMLAGVGCGGTAASRGSVTIEQCGMDAVRCGSSSGWGDSWIASGPMVENSQALGTLHLQGAEGDQVVRPQSRLPTDGLAAAWAASSFAPVYVPVVGDGHVGQPDHVRAGGKPVPSASGAVRGVDYRALIAQYGDWPVGEAERVMTCESSGNPSAVNGTSIGLMEINWPWHLAQLQAVTGSRNPLLLFVPAVNIAVAHLIWQDQGWIPWSCRP